MDKYNNMTIYEKSNFDYVLGDQFGYEAPVTLEKIENPTVENKTIVLDSNLAYRSSTYQIEE